MLKSYWAGLALGLAVVAVAIDSGAATPEEQAAFREEARRQTEQARDLERQADVVREQAKQIFIAEYKKADGLDDQASVKLVLAFQRWLQGGAKNHAKAALLRRTARILQVEAYEFELLALIADELLKNEWDRAVQLREAAMSLAGDSDPQNPPIIKELEKQADKNERDAQGFEKEAEGLRKQAERTNHRAQALIERALELEAAP